MTITANLVIYSSHLRLIVELEDEGLGNGLSTSRDPCSSAARSGACTCTRFHWQIDLDVSYKIGLSTATIRRGRGVIKVTTLADAIKVFPATACSV